MTEWNTPETAPRDRPILAYGYLSAPGIVEWCGREWLYQADGRAAHDVAGEPVGMSVLLGWMPVPEAPADQEPTP